MEACMLVLLVLVLIQQYCATHKLVVMHTGLAPDQPMRCACNLLIV